MIRRRPTVILLEDVESLQTFSLTTDFEKLTLDAQSDDDGGGSSGATTGIDLTAHSHSKFSHQRDTSSSRGMFASPSPAPPSTASTKSCLKSHFSIPQSLQNACSMSKPRRVSQSIDPPRTKVTFALSPNKQELHSGRVNRSPDERADGTDYQPRPNTITALHALDSPVTPQLSFLSCGVSSSPAMASVPLRDLALASTMSYEAALAEKTVSPALEETGEDHPA
ncbi:uncharacterized protein N7511_010889 [Penicillium nucicola]|uniref:uncharacterized protein n=1 Tax=Penicillium nucicola TaxID=1850975 RepID=UPI0025453469|nr:uncharacterized protein N7511_010889 [Penicillium nucicola]KAJ5749193.1 hypothetical protein N7511_010889 [Penicillium nucicola]